VAQWSLPEAISIQKNMKMIAKLHFLTPELYALLSARGGQQHPRGKAGS